MSYPTIRFVDANAWYNQSKQAEKILPAPRSSDISGGPFVDWNTILNVLTDDLQNLLKLKSAAFECEASILVHQAIPRHPAIYDSEFWSWCAIAKGAELIAARYGDPVPNCANFYSRSENYFFRLWLRGELGFRPNSPDPYFIARHGDIDFWRSHVFRQKITESPNLLEAFVKFQYPGGPMGASRLKQKEIRELIKALRRLASNLFVELLSDDEIHALLESEASKITQNP